MIDDSEFDPSRGRLGRVARLSFCCAFLASLLMVASAATSAAVSGQPPPPVALAPSSVAPSSVAPSSFTPSAPASGPAVPGMQPAAPGATQTPPAPPQAPGNPLTWIFIVFGILGVALLIAWAVLARRAADGEPEDSEGGDKPA